MSKRTNWDNVVSHGKMIKKGFKDSQGCLIFFNNLPKEGHMTDVIDVYKTDEQGELVLNEKGNKIKVGKAAKDVVIKTAMSSTLRRLVKQLDNYIYLGITTEAQREILLNKKVEIETELNKRKDGLTKN